MRQHDHHPTDAVQGQIRERRFRPISAPAARDNSRTAWVFVRISGIVLSGLVTGHFVATHIVTDVALTGSDFIATRWASAIWLGWDWVMLAAALGHGGVGAWIVIADHTPDPRLRRLARVALLVITAAAFAIGSVTIGVVILGKSG